MKKILFFLIILSFLLFPIFNCKKAEQKVYKIGAIFSITGANAFLGEPEKDTAMMIVEDFNKKNPDNKIELTVYDDEGDTTKAQNFATKLIEEEKVLAVIGPTLSGTSLKIIDIATENETPLISCAAALSIVEPVSERKWIFKTAQSDKLAVERIYKYLSSKEMKKIAIITVSNSFGQSGKNFLEILAPDYGLEIVENQTYGPEDSDMKAQLIKIKIANPDVLICWGTNPGPAYILKNAKELGLNITIFQSHGVGNKKYIELAGNACEGTYLVGGKLLIAETLPDSDVQKKLLLDYKKRYSETFFDEPSTFGGHAYDAMMLIIKAIEAKSITGDEREMKDKLRNYIENTKNFIGISGVFNMSPEDHNGLKEDCFAIIKIVNGKWTFVE